MNSYNACTGRSRDISQPCSACTEAAFAKLGFMQDGKYGKNASKEERELGRPHKSDPCPLALLQGIQCLDVFVEQELNKSKLQQPYDDKEKKREKRQLE